MSSELQGLLEAIRERPDDDLPRLALADWCMEQSDPVLQARGEFIQLRCQAALMRPSDLQRSLPEQRARELRDAYESRWLGSLAGEVDGWDFERGLVVIEFRNRFRRGWAWDRLTSRREWFWVIGAKGVLLPTNSVQRLAHSNLAEQLTQLDLSDCEVDPAGARALAASERLGRLTSLRLCYSRVGDEGAAVLARSATLERLTVLSLSASAVGPHGAQALTEATGLKRLAALDLSQNPLGQNGGRAIAGCSALAALSALDVSGCQLTDRGAWSLVHAAGLGRLVFLDVRDNGLSGDVREALRERFGERVKL